MTNEFQLAGYLAWKEIWRNKGRFFLVSLVIALITLLVLFIAALGEGLGNGNREYLSKLDSELIVFQENADLVIQSSRLPTSKVNAIRRVEGVAQAGSFAYASAAIVVAGEEEPVKIALLGLEANEPGTPVAVEGRQFRRNLADEVIIDSNTAYRSKLKVGDTLVLRSSQAEKEKTFDLTVVGIAEGQQLGLQPTVFIPIQTWEEVRPKSSAEIGNKTPTPNVVIIKTSKGFSPDEVKANLLSEIEKIEVGTLQEVIEALPGYTAQQSTLNTQGAFTLIIGILVIGGFFQIQVLQKVGQIGVLKAIGTTTPTVAIASIIQIVLITTIGVFIGSFLTFLLSLGFPPSIPIVFNGFTSLIAIIALMAIGPLGGLVSIQYASRIEPLKALGLSS